MAIGHYRQRCIFVGLVLLSRIGCAPAEERSPAVEPSASGGGLTRAWDGDPPPPRCRAGEDTALANEALALTGLDRERFGFSKQDLAASHDARVIDDAFRLSWIDDARARPLRSGCLEGEVVGPLDHDLAGPHPVAQMIRHAARLLGQASDVLPIQAPAAGGFDDALAAVCNAAGRRCGQAEGRMPSDLGDAITPLLLAIAEGLRARAARDVVLGPFHDPAWWQAHGGNGLLLSESEQRFNPLYELDRTYLLGGRSGLYGAAAQIAFAVEDIGWDRFAGRFGVRYDIETGAGWIRVRDASDQVYEDDGEDVLLSIDLGGNDTHLDDVASNRSAPNSVSIAIDLGGDDTYGYPAHVTAFDAKELLAADDGLRAAPTPDQGPVSLSNHFRQGAARNGIAMLFDLGTGNDRYQSLRGSQGYAHQGVGVLFDAGGDDRYLSEVASQGAAQYGIALLVDAGQGRDERRAVEYAQGFGFVSGAGFLVDGGGDDVYFCDPGDSTHGGVVLVPSPQLSGAGNTSFCQGAGFGRRSEDPGVAQSGGLGVLRDLGGDDRYEASVFAQGAGYWQGTGILSDREGRDQYDAVWYVQGSATHHGIGVFADLGEGADTYDSMGITQYMSLGAAHDFGIGVFIEEGGGDRYRLSTMSAGVSACNGIGLFVENAGDDQYAASSVASIGFVDEGGCGGEREELRSIGIMIDASGSDTYDYPECDGPAPQDEQSWAHPSGDRAAFALGLDRVGQTGVHAESVVVRER